MPARPLFVVVDWPLHFETYESARLVKACAWVAMPNKHDGKSYRRLTREKDGLALYGAWSLIVQIASKCPVRGTLADLDGPLSAEDLEDKTGLPARGFERLLEFAATDRIGWLRKITDGEEIADLLQPIRNAKTPRARKRADGSADQQESPRIPADSSRSPQAPADSYESPQSADAPADSRRSPHDAAPHVRARADRTRPDSTGIDHTHLAALPLASASSALSEVADFILGIFGKKRNRLSSDAEHELSRFAADLPLKPGQRALLEWFYRLPKDPQDFILTRRCNSADALAKSLFAQLDIAERYASDSGADVGTEKKSAPPEPPGWREWFAQQYPSITAPETWREVPESVRSEFELKGAA
jgi:hypothetical protein